MFSGNFDEFCHKCVYSKDDLPNIDDDVCIACLDENKHFDGDEPINFEENLFWECNEKEEAEIYDF